MAARDGFRHARLMRLRSLLLYFGLHLVTGLLESVVRLGRRLPHRVRCLVSSNLACLPALVQHVLGTIARLFELVMGRRSYVSGARFDLIASFLGGMMQGAADLLQRRVLRVGGSGCEEGRGERGGGYSELNAHMRFGC